MKVRIYGDIEQKLLRGLPEALHLRHPFIEGGLINSRLRLYDDPTLALSDEFPMNLSMERKRRSEN
jgi:hypothetical protein